MVQYVITPWRHQSELLKVRDALYGSGKDVEGMRGAVEVVGVWSMLILLFVTSLFPFQSMFLFQRWFWFV